MNEQLATLFDRPVAILGYGRSGAATAKAMAEAGVETSIWDDNANKRASAMQAGYRVAGLDGIDLRSYAAVIVSPGVPISGPSTHPFAIEARLAAIDLICDIELLFRSRPVGKFVGITGTNGKSTTTALVGHLLDQMGIETAIGGNIGTPALELPNLGDHGVYVLEVSSYQLDLLATTRFQIAVLLNVSPDHLDHHGSMGAYVAAKRKIFSRQYAGDTAIVGVDSEITAEIYRDLEAGQLQTVCAITGGDCQPRFATDTLPGIQPTICSDGGWLTDQRETPPTRIIDLSRIPTLPGRHNAENAAAAYAVVDALRATSPPLTKHYKSFAGLAHRQELVATIDGVTFINDSKATNLDAATRAVSSYRNIYWIAGGQQKPGDDNYAQIRTQAERIRRAYFIGAASTAFAEAFAADMPVSLSGDLEAAVIQAAADAAADRNSAGAVVLLSPACASFDQFDNFEVRGKAFRDAVEKLQKKSDKAADAPAPASH